MKKHLRLLQTLRTIRFVTSHINHKMVYEHTHNGFAARSALRDKYLTACTHTASLSQHQRWSRNRSARVDILRQCRNQSQSFKFYTYQKPDPESTL